MTLRVVPELYCFDINVSKAFFTDILGFSIKYERP
ncbi:VOC family protein, partial [Vibrio diabolicus]